MVVSSTNNKNNTQSSGEDWVGELIWSILVAAGRLLWWGARFPLLGAPVAVAAGVACWQGINAGFLTLVGFIALYALWGFVDENSLQRWVIDPPTHNAQTWWRYRRRWEHICSLHGLTAKLGDRQLIPALLGVHIGDHTDILAVRVVTGQSISHWQRQADALAAAWTADRITITATAPGEIGITIMRGDVLAEPVALPILGHHLLVAGATGAGKGSVLWSLIAGLAPDVKTGRVRLCVIDPKGGMELGPGASMFSFFAHDATGQTLEL